MLDINSKPVPVSEQCTPELMQRIEARKIYDTLEGILQDIPRGPYRVEKLGETTINVRGVNDALIASVPSMALAAFVVCAGELMPQIRDQAKKRIES